MWIFNMVSSSINLSSLWILLAMKFMYGKVFSGRTLLWFQGNLVLFAAAVLCIFRITSVSLPQFNCENRPHSLVSNDQMRELSSCRLQWYCTLPGFDCSFIEWNGLGFDVPFSIGSTNVADILFPNLEWIAGLNIVESAKSHFRRRLPLKTFFLGGANHLRVFPSSTTQTSKKSRFPCSCPALN